MPDEIENVRALFGLWPRGTLHRDIGRPYNTILAWSHRNSIPIEWWDAVIASAKKQCVAGVDDALLLRLAKKEVAQKGADARRDRARRRSLPYRGTTIS